MNLRYKVHIFQIFLAIVSFGVSFSWLITLNWVLSNLCAIFIVTSMYKVLKLRYTNWPVYLIIAIRICFDIMT